jgi:hypothetical protein
MGVAWAASGMPGWGGVGLGRWWRNLAAGICNKLKEYAENMQKYTIYAP